MNKWGIHIIDDEWKRFSCFKWIAKKSDHSTHFEGELQNLNIPPELLEMYLKCLRMLMVGNIREKCLCMVFGSSWFSLNQKYPKNICGIFIIPLFLHQIPKSDKMQENIYLNPILNLEKFIFEKLKLNVTFCYVCLLCLLMACPWLLCQSQCTLHQLDSRSLGFWALCLLNSFSKRRILHETKIPFLCGCWHSWWWPSGPSPCLKPEQWHSSVWLKKSSKIY